MNQNEAYEMAVDIVAADGAASWQELTPMSRRLVADHLIVALDDLDFEMVRAPEMIQARKEWRERGDQVAIGMAWEKAIMRLVGDQLDAAGAHPGDWVMSFWSDVAASRAAISREPWHHASGF